MKGHFHKPQNIIYGMINETSVLLIDSSDGSHVKKRKRVICSFIFGRRKCFFVEVNR